MRRLVAETRLSVHAFDEEVVPVFEGPASAFGDKEVEALRSRRALGASNLQLALERAKTIAATGLKGGAAKRVILVTDGYHAARVKAIAGEVGLVARTSPVPGSTGSVKRLLRESAAVAVGSIIGHRRLSSWMH